MCTDMSNFKITGGGSRIHELVQHCWRMTRLARDDWYLNSDQRHDVRCVGNVKQTDRLGGVRRE